MKRILLIISLLINLMFVLNKTATCQINIGGIPLSLSFRTDDQYETINIDKPDMQKTALEDELSGKRNKAYRIGLNLSINKGIQNSGTWTLLPNGDKMWRLKLTSKDAMALSVYYDKFYIPKGGKLFLYNDNYRKIIGAYTSINNSPSGVFATELTSGETVTLEYDQPENINDSAIINISEINYAYRSVNDFGSSESCEVNVNCSEGSNWKAQKQGVVRIILKDEAGTYLCSGSVVNNTRNDYTPYVLTADHCAYDGGGATTADLAQWIFYFNFESPTCANPSSEGNLASMTMTGATKIAEAGEGGATGSDFYLVLLNNAIPLSYNPFFIGWDKSNIPSPSGVGIHHPAGDIKKISTYDSTLITSDWNGDGILSHWEVSWDSTTNGHGVTEGGSSGSPIFNNVGRLVGTLTGGSSDCSNETGTDFYGKFYYHWNLNDSTPQGRLKEWLDPDSTGVVQLDGIFYSLVDFTADKLIIPVGTTVNFTDKSLGGPYQYQWQFKGAVPDTSNDQNPSNILYPTIGLYNVTMKIGTSDTSLIKVKNNYISVYDVIKFYPNPASDFVWIDLENNNYSTLKISIYNMLGMIVKSIETTPSAQQRIFIDTSMLGSGLYVFKIETNVNVSERKIIIFHK